MRNRYNASMFFKALLLATACGVITGLWGCQSSYRDAALDEDARQLIESRQALALGPHAEMGGPVSPTMDAADSQPTTTQNNPQPETINPSPDELPAESLSADELPEYGSGELPIKIPEGNDAIHLDLEALLGYAIANAPEYRNRKEDLFLSSLSLIIERHRWGPRFFNTVSSSIRGTPEGGDYDQVATLLNEFRVTQRLPYGGQVSVSALVDYVNFLRQASTNSSPQETQSAGLRLTMDLPLLRGAGVVAREDLIQAERNLIYAARDFERFRRSFLVELSRTYFDLLRQQGQLVNLERQLDGLERLADRFEALAAAGQEPAFEAERALQQVLFGRNNLLNARENYIASLDALKLRIGMPISQALVIDPSRVSVPEPKLDMQEAVQSALLYRLDLQTSSDRVDDARRDVRIARNNLLPDLDVSASLALNTDADRDIDGADFELEDSTYQAGITLDIPLDRRIEQASLRSALIDLERTARNHQVRRDQVALNVRRSVRAIEQARFSLELQNRNVEIAERRVVGVRLRERTLGPRDTIEAQEDLAAARNQRDTALANLQTSILQFLLDTGQLRVDAQGRWLPPAQLIVLEPDPVLEKAVLEIQQEKEKLSETSQEVGDESPELGDNVE